MDDLLNLKLVVKLLWTTCSKSQTQDMIWISTESISKLEPCRLKLKVSLELRKQISTLQVLCLKKEKSKKSLITFRAASQKVSKRVLINKKGAVTTREVRTLHHNFYSYQKILIVSPKQKWKFMNYFQTSLRSKRYLCPCQPYSPNPIKLPQKAPKTLKNRLRSLQNLLQYQVQNPARLLTPTSGLQCVTSPQKTNSTHLT